ncbi:MAG: DNA modification methylase [Patescibacteria group bacterium]|nr:DNA modification methylase [Patescibacteria group bacterium]MDE2019412.1 DNA modification methylase [Patescibacteria group bacterium]
MSIKPNMEIVAVKIANLHPAEYNPRTFTDKEFSDLKESIARFGIVEPFVVNAAENRKNVLIGGHFRLKVAQALGYDEVPVVYVNIPDLAKEQELNIRLNKNTGEFDWKLLASIDEGILLDVGFQKVELREKFGINKDIAEDDFDAEKEYDAISEPTSKFGEIYELGRHRLMCGDSTDPQQVAKLVKGAKANLIFTDPPYNVDYKYAKYEAIHGGRRKKFIHGGQIFNDNKSPQEFYEFLLAVFKNAHAHTTDDAPIYVCHATKTQEQFFKAFAEAGFHFSQTIIWLKERIILAMGQDFHRVYEPIIFGWKEGQKHYTNKFMTTEKELWDLDRLAFEERLDVWFQARDKSKDYEHPTQKPVRLVGRAIRKSCPPDGAVLDLFGGSGSTLLAAEQSERSAFLMELDPAYCDVIRKRYETFVHHRTP